MDLDKLEFSRNDETYPPIQQPYTTVDYHVIWGGELPENILQERQEEIRVYNQRRNEFVQQLNSGLAANNKKALVELLLDNDYFPAGNIWFLMNEPEIREILIQHSNNDLVYRVMSRVFRSTRGNQRMLFWLWRTITDSNVAHDLLDNYSLAEIDKNIFIDAAAYDDMVLETILPHVENDYDMLFELADTALDQGNSDTLEVIFDRHPYLLNIFDWRRNRKLNYIKKKIKQRSNWLLRSLTENYMTLQKAIPTLPKDLTRKIILRAQYKHLCRDLEKNDIPPIELIKLMNILGLEYNWLDEQRFGRSSLWNRKEVCSMVREVLEKVMEPEISRMEIDIAETLRRQELEELDRREQKRLKQNPEVV